MHGYGKVLAVLCALAGAGGSTARAEQADPPLIFPRCDNVLPTEVRQRFFAGWKAEERQDCPDCPPVCGFSHRRSRSEAKVAYVCGGHQNTEAEMHSARAEDKGTEIPGLGSYAYRSTDEGWATVDTWDDDSPCVLVVQWKGKDQDRQAQELARVALAAATRERVDRPVLDALLWTSTRDAEPEQKLLARWQKDGPVVQSLVQLSTGFPRPVTGTEVPGIPAGQRALVLGYCSLSESASILEWLQGFYPGVKSVRVELPKQARACPQPLQGVQKVDARSSKAGSKRLTVALYQQPVGEHQMRYVLLASLADASGGLLDTQAAEPITSQITLRRPDEPHCANRLQPASGKLVATSVCEWDPSGCRRKGVDRYTRTFRVVAGTIQVQQEHSGSDPDCSTGD